MGRSETSTPIAGSQAFDAPPRRPERHARGRRGSIARRLGVVLATMLLPLVAVAATGIVTFRTSVGGLEQFREETVGEAKLIDAARGLLVEADDLGELYVETDDAALDGQFQALSRRLERAFDNLKALSTSQERDLAVAARALWNKANADLALAAMVLDDSVTDDRLDPFHDHIDEAGSQLSTLHSLNVAQVADEISSLRSHEQLQLFASLATVVVGLFVAGLLARRVRRSITSPLLSLEEAATHFGSDDLSHQIHVRGDDEFARVSSAFNEMASKLQTGRDELHHLALHDPLTGLPNRALFVQHMEHAIERSRRRGTRFSVLYADLDGFKAVNDTLGHEAGDEVLVAVAARLSECLRAEDVVARLGGDEFGILLEDADVEIAIQTAERLTAAFDGGLPITASEMPIGISIGVATREAHEELDQLLRRADAAMYTAKGRTRRGRLPELEMDAGRRDAQVLRADLQLAVERQEFVVHYQPIVNVDTGAVEAVEALVRWNHPKRGLLPPAAFLGEAEGTGQVLFIDKYVLNEACRQVCVWQRDLPGAANLSASVNLSASQLQHPGLAEEVAEALSSSGLPPERLILEITESALLSETETVVTELHRLKALGVQIALDDFGTGYSSLSHVLHFPVDIIKIDRSFVSAIGNDEVRSQVALAVVTLSKTLGLKTVAEGIEDTDQLNRLRSAQCEFGQGYLFAKPLASSELELFFRRGSYVSPEGAMVPRYEATTLG